MYLFMYLFIYLCINLFIYLCIYLCNYLFIYSFIYLFIDSESTNLPIFVENNAHHGKDDPHKDNANFSSLCPPWNMRNVVENSVRQRWMSPSIGR